MARRTCSVVRCSSGSSCVVCVVELLTHAGAKQVGQLRQVKVPVQATPAANFVMVQTQFLFGLAKAAFYRPTPKGHTQQPPQRDATLPGHTVGQEVFHLVRQNVACYDQAVPTPRQAIDSLAPELRPFHLPDFGAVLGVLDAVTLPLLLAEDGRIARQVLHFAAASAPRRQPRIKLFAAPPPRPTPAEHPRLFQPAAEIRRHFAHEYLSTLFETVQKGRVAAVAFVKRPGLDAHTVGQGAVDQLQGDLRLGTEHDLVGDVTFFRRSGSSAQSWGR